MCGQYVIDIVVTMNYTGQLVRSAPHRQQQQGNQASWRRSRPLGLSVVGRLSACMMQIGIRRRKIPALFEAAVSVSSIMLTQPGRKRLAALDRPGKDMRYQDCRGAVRRSCRWNRSSRLSARRRSARTSSRAVKRGYLADKAESSHCASLMRRRPARSRVIATIRSRCEWNPGLADRDLHIEPDWLLALPVTEAELRLARTGTSFGLVWASRPNELA